MQHARFPLEVCERVIDFCSSCPRFFYPQHLADLRACALTCQDWVPRSRFNLYRSIRLRNARQFDAFLSTLAIQPFLADFVQELVVGRSTATPGDPSEKYLPFAQADLVSALRGMRRLHLCHYQWQAHHPRYHQFAAQYTIVELSLLGGTYRTLADVFRVVWAFEHLQVLRLSITELLNEPDIPLAGIIKNRKTRVCCNLKTVVILEPALLGTKTFPPLGCFGNSLTYLSLFWTQELGHIPSEALLLYLSASSALQHITWQVDFRDSDGRGYRVFCDCMAYVSRALRRIPADGSLRWITLDYGAPAAMGISRTYFINSVNLSLDEAFERFAHFEGLILLVPEPNPRSFGVTWWTDQISESRQEYDVQVDVRPGRAPRPARTVWVEERDFTKRETEDEHYWENGQMRLLSECLEQL